jgi:hypothetical protein
MKHRALIVPAAVMLAALSLSTVVAQSPKARSTSATGAAIPRTFDGHPEMQGYWTNDTVTPLDSIADELQKVGVGTLDATLTKTSQTKQIAGFPCTVHDINLSLPFSPTGQSGQGMDLNMVLSGTVCLSTAAPGLADYQAFYKAAADSGFIFGDPRMAKSPTGAAQAKAYAALTRKMAEAGVALESRINITASGDNPMASLMASAAKSDIITTVTKIEAGALPAESFEIPTDYKVKTQK